MMLHHRPTVRGIISVHLVEKVILKTEGAMAITSKQSMSAASSTIRSVTSSTS